MIKKSAALAKKLQQNKKHLNIKKPLYFSVKKEKYKGFFWFSA